MGLASIGSLIIKILLFAIIIGVVVISHEFGHYLLARANGIHVVEFAIGMGPTLFAFTKGETKYSLKLLPIGGACMFEGEDGLNVSEDEESTGSYQKANVWSRISTVFAGPLFNFILAFILAFVMVQLIAIKIPVISEIDSDSAAMRAGLQVGDRIISMDHRKVYLFNEIYYFNQLNKGQETKIVYERDGVIDELILVPDIDEKTGDYILGIYGAVYHELKGLDVFKYSWYEVRSSVINTYASLKMVVTGKVSRNDVSGPIGIASAVGDMYETMKESAINVFINVLNMMIMLSVNLGIFNLLPLPALDGGRLVFLLVEVVRKKPISPEKEGLVHFIGLAFFMILMIFIFYNDGVRLIGKIMSR